MNLNFKNYWLFLLGAVLLCSPLNGNQNDSYLDLLQENLVGPVDTFGNLYAKGKAALKATNYEEAIDRFSDAFYFAEQLGDAYSAADASYMLGKTHYVANNYPLALKYYFDYLTLPRDITSNKKYARSFAYIAAIYQSVGNYDKALRFQYDALKIQEESKDSSGIMMTYYILGNILYYKEEYERAVNCYEKTYDIGEAIDNSNAMILAMCALGSCYEKQDELERAKTIQLEAYRLSDSLSNKLGIISSLQNMGTTLTKMGRYTEAEQYLLQSVEVSTNCHSDWGIIVGYKHLGILFFKQGNFPKAEYYLLNGLQLAEQNQEGIQQMEIHEQLSALYHEQSRDSEAFFHLESYQALKDSIHDPELSEEVHALEFNDVFREQKLKITERELEIKLLEEQTKVKQYRIFALLGSLFFVIIVSFILGKFYLKQQKLTTLLEEKNSEIEEKNKRLAAANSELKHFTYAASHDLKAPLRTIHSFTNLLNRRYGKLIDENGKEYIDFILGAANRMQNLLKDLLDYARLGNEVIPDSLVDLDQVIRSSLYNLQDDIDRQNAEITLPEGQLPKVKGHQTQLLQVFQNIIGNALKFHQDAVPKINISFDVKDDRCVFAIRDNGIGIPSHKREKIFEMFTRLNDNTKYEGTGIGLATCKKIIERHGGKIWVESESQKGSIFFFTLPVEKVRNLSLDNDQIHQLPGQSAK